MVRSGLWKPLLAACAAVLLGAAEVRADEIGSRGTLPSFAGRSGATQSKLVVVCGVPVRPASETWRDEPPAARANNIEHFLRTLPAKYRPLVGEYFEKLLQLEGEK